MGIDGDENPYVRGVIWLGLVIMLAGIAPVWMAVTGDRKGLHAPLWVVFGSGLMFFNAGVVTGSMDTLFNPLREHRWFSWIQAIAGLSIPVLLMVILNWVAFGRGEREFSMSVSIPFLSFNFPRSSEILGRVAFGIPALLCDLIALGAVYKLMADWINGDGSPWRW